MEVSQAGLDLIKQTEGLRLTAYRDAGGWAIGYGHNSPSVVPGKTITPEQADELLRQDVRTAAQGVLGRVKTPLAQNQFDALVSMTYNIGTGAFKDSTLAKKLDAGDFEAAASEFSRWNKSEGKELSALTARREQEMLLFTGGQGPSAPVRAPAMPTGNVQRVIPQADGTYETTAEAVRTALQVPTRAAGGGVAPEVPRMSGAQVQELVGSSPASQIQATYDQDVADERFRNSVTWGEKAQATWDDTFMGSIMRNVGQLARDERNDTAYAPNPDFNPVAAFGKVASKYSEDQEIRTLLNTTSQEDFDAKRLDLERIRGNEMNLSRGSMGGTLAVGLGVSLLDPMTYIASGAGVKAAYMARLGSGYAAAAVGGAAGNVAYDAARAAAGAHVTTVDVTAGAFLGAGLGALGRGLHAPAEWSARAENQARDSAAAFTKAAEEQRAVWFNRAAEDAGPTATPEDIARRVQNMEASEVRRAMEVVLAPVEPRDHLIPSQAGEVNMTPVRPELGAPGETPQLGATGLVQETASEFVGREATPTLADRARGLWDRIRPGKTQDIDPDGLDLEPSPELRQALRGIYDQSHGIVGNHPIDTARLNPLLPESLRSTGVIMLSSTNPVVKATALMLLENTTGAARNRTASMTKDFLERMYVGDIKRELENLHAVWNAREGTPAVKEFLTNDGWTAFNKEIYRVQEGRRQGIMVKGQHSDIVDRAVDVIERQYDLMRRHQGYGKTIGYAALPQTSEGYVPWMMSPSKVAALSDNQLRSVANKLSEEFQVRSGWDQEFSDKIARQYLKRAKDYSLGGTHIPMNPYSSSAAEIVREAFEAQGMTVEQVRTSMDQWARGGASHTQSRMNRNLNSPFYTDDGKEFTLADIMETDQIALLQRQARRVSGDVSLSMYGVNGQAGLRLLREAMKYGAEGQKATPAELQAFDQIAAEFTGSPFMKNLPAWADNIRAATGLVRLGGMALAQLGEMYNAIPALGLSRVAKGVPDFGRLLSEVHALKKGGTVSNPILQDLEKVVGTIGTDNYRMDFPFQMADNHIPAYGRDSIGAFSKLIRGGQYLQGKLSFWRALHAVQERFIAEQTVHKAISFIRQTGPAPSFEGLEKAKAANTFTGQTSDAGSGQGFTQPKGTPADKIFSNFADNVKDTPGGLTAKEKLARFREAMFQRADADVKEFAKEGVSLHQEAFGTRRVSVETSDRGVTRVRVMEGDEVVAAARIKKGMVDSIASKQPGSGLGTDLLRYLRDREIANVYEVPDRSPGYVKSLREILQNPDQKSAAGDLRTQADPSMDAALKDMGFSPELAARIRDDLPNVAVFDSQGRLTRFTPTNTQDPAAMKEFVDATWRGTRQIIQGTFVGETGKWAHDGLLKMMTQFRTYPLVAMEKQMTRQFRNQGTAKALGYFLGGLSVMVPIQLARIAINAAGMPASKREDYIDNATSPQALVISAMGYLATAGLARDVLDIPAGIMGWETTGPRGQGRGIVSQTLPGVGLIDDVYGALSAAGQRGDLSALRNVLPLSRLPYLVPGLNALTSDD